MPQDILPLGSTLTVQEIDGTPTVQYVQGILFSNGSVTDNGDGTVTVVTGSPNAYVQGGNAFGTTATLGTTDNQDLSIITHNVERIRIDKATGYTAITATAVNGDGFDVFAADPAFAVASFGGTNINNGGGPVTGMFAVGVEGQAGIDGPGSIDPASAGVWGNLIVQGVNATSTVLNGVLGTVDSSSSGTTVDIRSVAGGPITSPNVTPTNAISIYGHAQTVGTNNWAGYFDGNVHIGGNLNITGTGAGHVIEDEGTPLTARANLNFVGPGVAATDDSGNNASKVTVNRWEPLTNGDGTTPELIFDSFGDVIMVEVTV